MIDPSAAPATAQRTIAQHIKLTLALAWPVVISRTSILIMVSVDVAMTGQAGQIELAYISLAMAVQVMLLMIGVGTLFGTAVLIAQADGAGDIRACGGIWRLALIHAMGLGAILGLACLAGGWFLLAIGQDADVARGGGRVLDQFAWGMMPMFMAVVTSMFLEATGRPRPGMYVMVAANIVNVALNWVFVYGNLGVPELGAEGAILATSIVRWLTVAALIGYIYLMPSSARYGIRGGVRAPWSVGRKLRRIGYPMGFAQGIEASAFSGLVLLAGYLGTAALGGYQIGQNLIALAFMCAIGIGTATTVRDGNAIGRNDQPGIAAAGWTGVGLVVFFMALIGLVFVAQPTRLAMIYSADPAVIAVATPLILIVSAALVFDGIQGVLMAALRGTGDVWVPVCFHLLSFWALALPAGAYFAFAAGLGAPGLMVGLLIGVLAAASFLMGRFHIVSRRNIRRL